MQRWMACILLCSLGWSVSAQEHPACRDLVMQEADASVEGLLAIAESCRLPEVSELYYNRANHRRLLLKYELFERSLQHYGDWDNQAYIESYRIHIGLAEAFARARLQQQDRSVLRRLNRVYDKSGEIAEMRFRGYDLLADRLEEKFRL